MTAPTGAPVQIFPVVMTCRKTDEAECAGIDRAYRFLSDSERDESNLRFRISGSEMQESSNFKISPGRLNLQTPVRGHRPRLQVPVRFDDDFIGPAIRDHLQS